MANLARRLAPLGNRVLVQKALAETVTAGGKLIFFNIAENNFH